MAFNKTEQEAVILNAVLGMIDDMVNFAIFMPLERTTHQTNLMPQSSNTLRLFNVLLRDFLSPVTAQGRDSLPFDLVKPPSNDRQTDHTFLFYLRQVCGDPRLGTDVKAIREPLDGFVDFLEGVAFVPDVWLPSLEIQLDLRIKRITFLRICGDIGKHNFIRLGGQVNAIRRILAEHGHAISKSDAYLVVPEFWEWFHEHLFAYHASTIAEFLNNLRYGILDYAEPQAMSAYRKIDDLRYDFDRPSELVEPFACRMYFGLMLASLRKPFFPRFSVTRSLKNQF